MKISVNDQELFSLSDMQKKVCCNEIPSKDLDVDFKRRLQWVLMHKYEQCFRDLRSQWESKLKERGVQSIPLDEEEFAKLVFSQPDYMDRDSREVAAKL